MQEGKQSRGYEITDEAQAQALSNPFKRHLLLRAAITPKSTNELAQAFSLSVEKVHYHVQKLKKLGLLEVAKTIERPGRAIKMYQAIASSFFVPDHLLDDPHKLLHDEMAEGLQSARLASEGGLLFSISEGGKMAMRRVASEGSSAKLAEEGWFIIPLSSANAKALQKDLFEIAEKYQNANRASDEPPHLVHLAITKRPGP